MVVLSGGHSPLPPFPTDNFSFYFHRLTKTPTLSSLPSSSPTRSYTRQKEEVIVPPWGGGVRHRLDWRRRCPVSPSHIPPPSTSSPSRVPRRKDCKSLVILTGSFEVRLLCLALCVWLRFSILPRDLYKGLRMFISRGPVGVSPGGGPCDLRTPAATPVRLRWTTEGWSGGS